MDMGFWFCKMKGIPVMDGGKGCEHTNATELYTQKWLRWSIKVMFILLQLKKNYWKRIPGLGNSKCKGPVVGMSWCI